MWQTLLKLTCIAAVLVTAAALPGDAQDKKEPSAEAQQTAKVLKGNLPRFSLLLYRFGGKEGVMSFRLVANKELTKDGEKATYVISEAKAQAVIDALMDAGQFDKPRFIPPPGIAPPGWYLYVSAEDARPARPKGFQWRLGGLEYDAAADPAVRAMVKVLEGDSKTALERLVGGKR